jgi:chromosomal replication initiator protein
MTDDPCDDWSGSFHPFRSITVARIQSVVAEVCDIPLIEMTSQRRAREVARPRQVAMYLAKEMTPRSLPEIGRRFGGRDHTTVMHAIRQIKRLRFEDAELERTICRARFQLQGAA